MIKHVFILIWNQRKTNSWILTELFLASVCLWFVVDYFYVLGNVLRQPSGFDISYTYRIDLSERTPDSDEYIDPLHKESTTGEDLLTIVDRIHQHPDIEAVSLSKASQPYSATGYSGSLPYRQLYYTDTIGITAQEYLVTPSFFMVFRNRPDDETNDMLARALRAETIILSEDTKIRLLGDDLPYGKEIRLDHESDSKKLEMVCAPVRWTEYFKSHNCFYRLLSDDSVIKNVDSTNLSDYELCVRVKPGSDSEFSVNFTRDMANSLSAGNVYLADVRSSSVIRKAVVAPEEGNVIIRFSLFLFILINIFLGVSGTFMFRTQHRRSEMGLRIAVGSSKKKLRCLLITEGLILLTLAIVPAMLVDFNMAVAGFINEEWEEFTLLRFVIGIATTYLIMSLMIVTGIWYPAKRTTKIQPTEALKDE